MSYLKAVYRDCPSCNDHFHNGIEYLNQRLVVDAIRCFEQACVGVSKDQFFFNKYTSFLGFARVLNGDSEGISLCRHAADCETKDGDVFLALARAELFLRNRYAAVLTINRGLRIDRSHLGLLKLREQMGQRRKSFVPFLARNHPINRLIGQRLRKDK